jgi:hypothetical protein
LDQAHDLLRPLARANLSGLPARMRNDLAAMVLRLGRYGREIRRYPDRIASEKADETAEEPGADLP